MTATITVVELFAKCLVAAVLLGSGVAKLSAESETTDRRLPSLLAVLDQRAGRLGLGAVEVALGALSVLALGSPWVDTAVLLLCLGFFGGSAVLGLTRPGVACRCFGAASSSAFGARHTVLTGVLAVGALLAFVGSLQRSDEAAWSWHPLSLVTLAGLLLLASRVRRLPELADGRSK